jgi:hypothetical protein
VYRKIRKHAGNHEPTRPQIPDAHNANVALCCGQ